MDNFSEYQICGPDTDFNHFFLLRDIVCFTSEQSSLVEMNRSDSFDVQHHKALSFLNHQRHVYLKDRNTEIFLCWDRRVGEKHIPKQTRFISLFAYESQRPNELRLSAQLFISDRNTFCEFMALVLCEKTSPAVHTCIQVFKIPFFLRSFPPLHFLRLSAAF